MDPKIFHFGVKSIAPYDRATGKPLGFAEVVGSGGLELAGEMVTLQGGSNRYPYENAHGFIEPKITVNCKEFPSWLYSLVLGATPTNPAIGSGLVRNIENTKGTTLQSDAAINGVTISTPGEVKFGKYTVVFNAAGPSVDVFISSDVDSSRGAMPLALYDNFLKINENPLMLAQDNDIVIPNIGTTLGVAAAADFDLANAADGDAFTFELVPQSEYFREVIIGRNEDAFPVFGLYMYAEKVQGGATMFIDCYKVRANGLPHTLTEKAWSESEISFMPVQDGARGVARIQDLVA